MRSYIAVFLVALVTTVAVVPLVRAWAFRIGALSRPGGRHVHARPIPRLGGVAIAVGWLLPVLLGHLSGLPLQSVLDDNAGLLVGVVLGGLGLCAVGAWDDARTLRARYKFVAQVLFAVWAFACGFRIEAVALPLFGTLEMGIFALPVTVLWIVGITNAVNLIDGLDGLAAGVTFFACATSFIVAFVSGSTFVAVLMAAMMGALLGFLFFNFNPARIFMGDSGSYFLGYVIGTVSLAGAVQQKTSTAVSLLVPMIALGVPIFDTLFTMVRRFLERRPIFSADRRHVHHRLLELGLTHRRAVLLLYGVSIFLASGAIGVSLGRSWEVGVALFSVCIVLVGLVRFLGYFEYLHIIRRQKSRIYDVRTEQLRRELPGTLQALLAARRETAVLDEIKRLVVGLDLCMVELVGADDKTYAWTAEGFTPGTRDAVQASFPIGRDGQARARIRFVWNAESEDIAPQVDILLQVVVDAITAALVRCASELAPATLQELQQPVAVERTAAIAIPRTS